LISVCLSKGLSANWFCISGQSFTERCVFKNMVAECVKWVIWLQPEYTLDNNIERLSEDHRRAKEAREV
jgi:hypothetical protein